MAELDFPKNKIKPVILEVMNDLFNISDIEEAKKTPIGRLISLEVKVDGLAREMHQLGISLRGEMKTMENTLRSEMKAMEKTFDAKFDQINARLAYMEKIQYIILAALAGGLIKIIFFP